MNSNIINAAPYANLLGIQDASGRPPVREPEQRPTHLPHVYLYAEKGPTLPHLVSGDSLTEIYGHKTLDPRSPYYNHQSVLTQVVQGEGNVVMVQRVIPADAGPKARLLLSVDIVEEPAVQQYERNADGTYKLDASGAKIPVTGPGATAPGHIVKWVLNDWHNGRGDDPFGQVQTQQGSLVSSTAEQSTLYPILELEVNFVGAYGNNLGIRLTAPTTRSNMPLNDSVAELVKAYLYRLQIVQRADSTLTPQIVETLSGEQYIEFALKPNAINTKNDTELTFDDIFMQAFQDVDSPGLPPKYGPFGRFKVYRDNLETVLAKIGAAEAPKGLLPEPTMSADSEYLYHVNPFTATDFHGVPYYTVQLKGPLDGGISFNENTTLWATGASDGTMNDVAFDALVRAELLNYGHGEADLLNSAVYTQSTIWDTGFSMDTKLAMLTPIGRRKDMWVALATQDVTEDINTPSEDSSIAVSLRTAARNYPESEIYGTSVCRAIIVGGAGRLINSKYRKPLPLTIELAQKIARYMGAGNGVWRSGLGPDMPPNNQITMFRDVNVVFRSATQRARDWENGMIWAQSYDRRSLFFPALQTVYNDDSSILNSLINMVAAVELEKVAQEVWRDLTGISSLTPEQFIARSNRLIEAKVEGRFDGRFVIVPNTYFTERDVQRGYSWSCKIDLYGPNMQTVGSYTIVAHRRSDLEQGA